MAFDLNALLGQIGRDKGIDKNILVEAIESAMLSAAKKHYGHNLNLETQYDPDTGLIELLQFKAVVEAVEDEATQISVEDARKTYDAEAMDGDEFGEKLDTSILGRVAAQTAKQVIIQKVRDAERGVIFEEYKDSKGDLINGIVQRYDRGDLIINLGRTEAILPKREQISRERYRQNDRIRGMILDIDRTARGPQIILTRSHPDFLSKLFELEVPEIGEGTIEIKGVAREAGDRAKIAVRSTDSSLDPVGACVGIKGARVHAVVQELRGEKIDIIPWTPDEPSFIARALSPAEVAKVLVDEDEHSIEVIVADDQLAFAIGRGGSNVRLASRLTGWKIDVRSASVAEEETKKSRASIEAIPGINFTHAELLFQMGYQSAKDVADAQVDDILEIEGMTEELAKELIENAGKVEDLVFTNDESDSDSSDSSDIPSFEGLILAEEMKKKLYESGYSNTTQVAEAFQAIDAKIDGFEGEDFDIVKKAVDNFFGNKKAIF